MGPVSSTGRAMMASLNGAMQQGMPVDQAIAYVKSMAKDGVAPLVDLYSMLNQYQRLQQQQAQAPQTPPTIRDEIMAQAQQAEMQQAMQQAQMQQGLGGLDTGVMENAQYAGGGIVAFQEGGAAGEFNPQQFLDPLMKFITRPEDELIREDMERRSNLAEEFGIGPNSEVMQARRQQVEQMRDETSAVEKQERMLDRAQFFFDLAKAGAQPGSTLLSSLAEAGGAYTKSRRATNERLRLLQKNAQDAGLKMLEAEELRKRGDFEAANRMLQEGRKEAIDTGMELYKISEQNKRTKETTAAMRAQVSEKGVDAERAELARQMREIGDPNNPEYIKLQSIYNALTPSIASAGIRTAGRPNPADLQALKDAGKELQMVYYFSDDDPRKIAAIAKYNAIYVKLTRQGIDVESLTPMLQDQTTGENPYSSMSDAEVLQGLGLR